MPANAKLYRELSDPFESSEEAQKAWDEFFVELGELRKKHGFPDVHVIATGYFIQEDGSEGGFVLSSHYGDQARALSMTAYAYGAAQAEADQNIAELLKHKKVPKAKP